MAKAVVDIAGSNTTTLQRSNSANIGRSQRSLMMAVINNRVEYIFLMREVLQVANSIVRAITIYMIWFLFFGTGTKKGGSYQAVNLSSQQCPLTAKHNLKISIIQRRFQNTSATPETPDASQVRDEMRTFEANYITPLFRLKFLRRKDLIHRVASLIGCGCEIGECFQRSPSRIIALEAV